jgi:hypothetical protein
MNQLNRHGLPYVGGRHVGRSQTAQRNREILGHMVYFDRHMGNLAADYARFGRRTWPTPEKRQQEQQQSNSNAS